MHPRKEDPADTAVVARIVRRAFEGHPHSRGAEVAIIRELRKSDALTVALVAEIDDRVLGYVAASPVAIAGNPSSWYGLGPVAVDPPEQRKGLGTLLVTHCLAQLRDLGAGGCVVLGDPAYYGRFGFKSGADLVYPGPPQENFMALPFGGELPSGEVSYAAAFSAG